VAERAGQAAAVVELVAGRALAAGVQVLVGDEPLASRRADGFGRLGAQRVEGTSAADLGVTKVLSGA
jgi:hypothetical protein